MDSDLWSTRQALWRARAHCPAPGSRTCPVVDHGHGQDASGAVLPGVTVEAASPVLIEKVRSSVTDGTGQYRIVDLRPARTRSRSR